MRQKTAEVDGTFYVSAKFLLPLEMKADCLLTFLLARRGGMYYHFEEGKVLQVQKKAGKLQAELKLFPSAESARCAACGRCFRPGRIDDRVTAVVDEKVANQIKEGMRVRVEVTTPAIYGPVFVVFGLPLLGLIGAGLLTYGLGGGELAVAAAALAGAVCGLLCAMFGFRQLMRRAERKFRVIDIAEELNNDENSV
ncbi:MAG: hypothetical protein DRP63_02085 [Planctomycetota bacterium]|nr:MAG: hypothetical protein DRP63_02085 [Planctomycetota bacterium]